jgi:Tfp pilus assembly protein PilV
MTTRPLHLRPLATGHWQLATPRRGFSFAEIMFAVMILAIGFIMVAAIFPVAIRQQQASMEDTSGVATAKRAAALIQQVGVAFAQYNPAAKDDKYGNYTNLIQDDPTTIFETTTTLSVAKSKPVLVPFQTDASASPVSHSSAILPYRYVKGDLIQQSDRRLAWVPVAYASQTGSAYASVYLVAIQSRANDQFTDSDRDKSETDTTAPFFPVACHFKLVEGGDSYPDTLVFTNGTNGAPADEPAAAEGAFVWVADDNVTAKLSTFPTYKAPSAGDANGRFYRLGAKRDDMGPGVWELQPGYDMTVTTTPGPDNDWNTTTDNQEQNENLPPRPTEKGSAAPLGGAGYSISGKAASGLLVGRGRERITNGTTVTYGNFAGNAMPLYALPPVTVRIHP